MGSAYGVEEVLVQPGDGDVRAGACCGLELRWYSPAVAGSVGDVEVKLGVQVERHWKRK